MTSMEWHVLPESGSILSAADELSENQRAEQGIYWTLWDSMLSDDLNTTSVYSDNHGNNSSFDTSEHCSTIPSDSEEQPGYPSHSEPLQTNDMFLSQFSDEEVTLDMFPDSMHRLMSYEHMLSGALVSGSQNQDDMDTCGFPLYFSHGALQDDDDHLTKVDGGLPSCAKLLEPSSSPEFVSADTSSMDKAGMSTTERSYPDSPGTEEVVVLEELEEVMFQMGRTTRICLRDAFFRLANSSRPPLSAAAAEPRASTRPRRRRRRRRGEEREASAIDRTVVSLTLTMPPAAVLGCCPAPCVPELSSPSPDRQAAEEEIAWFSG